MSATGNTTLAVSWDGTALIGAAKAVCEHAVPMQDIGTVTIDLGSQPWGWFTAELCALPATWPRPSCRTYFLRHGVAWDPGLRNPHLHRLAAPLIVEGKLRGALVLGGTPLTLPASSLPVMTERLLAVAQAVCVRLRACG